MEPCMVYWYALASELITEKQWWGRDRFLTPVWRVIVATTKTFEHDIHGVQVPYVCIIMECMAAVMAPATIPVGV